MTTIKRYKKVYERIEVPMYKDEKELILASAKAAGRSAASYLRWLAAEDRKRAEAIKDQSK
jgi:hypothetical protein